MFRSIHKTRKAAIQFLKAMFSQYSQLIELSLVQRRYVPDKLLSADAPCLIEAKACVLRQGRWGIAFRWIDRERNLAVDRAPTTGAGCDSYGPALESAAPEHQDEMETFERNAEVLVANQPDVPDARG